ncbi:MAG: hypothetical protein B6D46_05675 [Polyangiaceae bacterium UTPRO1]|jgi:hypothetical protein|nr:fibronectin type III domain-containing protein [Myxococcales bacterium]OQY67511.1 MAG: hypothetical protein B6D46_05675 [Polyangiaceae bacterium UTPRO1]
MVRRRLVPTVLAVLITLAGSAVTARAYSVVIRWTAADDPTIAGYLVHVRPEGGPERDPIDIPRPRRDKSGRFEAVLGDLAVETTYTFTINAYDANGTAGELSNPYTIGYRQAARVVDSDHDGLVDADEDRNLNQRVDPGETDRLVADSDGDGVPDGIETTFGSNPLDGRSPSCAPLEFSSFRMIGKGSVNAGWEAELQDMAVAMTPSRPRPTSVGVMYPQSGKGTLADSLLVTRVRDNDPFSLEITARSIDGKAYRLRYDGFGGVDRVARRRLQRSLGANFSGARYEPIGIDVANDMQRIDPAAVFDHIERLAVRGNLVMQQPRSCR